MDSMTRLRSSTLARALAIAPSVSHRMAQTQQQHQTQQLANLLSLDVDTTKSQILPYLATLTTPDKVRFYLSSLLPPRSTVAQAWTESYVESRFGSPSPIVHVQQSDGAWGRLSSKPPPTTKATRKVPPVTATRTGMENQFGSTGKVYFKNRGDEDGGTGAGAGWGGGGSSSSSRNASGRNSSSLDSTLTSAKSATPAGVVAAPQPPARTATSQGQGKGKGKPSSARASPVTLDLSPQAATELLAIDRELRALAGPRIGGSSSAGKGKERGCFCAGE